MNRFAMRSVCKRARPPFVLEVKKNVRIGLRADSKLAFLEGLAIAGAKSPMIIRYGGSAKAQPCY
jgi:hypothetical protein